MVESKEDIDNKNEIAVKPTQQEIHRLLKLITFSNFSTFNVTLSSCGLFQKALENKVTLNSLTQFWPMFQF